MAEEDAPPTTVAGYLQKFSPFLKGVMTLVGLVSSIEAAREKAEFKKKLLGELQKQEEDLRNINSSLNEVLDELKKIEKTIAAQEINKALVAIETYGDQLAALDPADEAGRVDLANTMLQGGDDSPKVLGAMNTIHNAMTGESLGGTPFIELLSTKGALRIHARLIQALHQLAFMCAFNDKEHLEYDAFLWQWSVKLGKERRVFLSQPTKVKVLQPEAWPGLELYVGDTIGFYEDIQSSMDGVGLYEGSGDTWTVHHQGTCGYGELPSDAFDPTRNPAPENGFSFADLTMHEPAGDGRTGAYLFVDLKSGKHTLDPASDLAKSCQPSVDSKRWLRVLLSLGPYGEDRDTWANRGALFSAARSDPTRTFLGASLGTFCALSERTPFVGRILENGTGDGAVNVDSNILIYDPSDLSVTSADPDYLSERFYMTHALWTVSWAGKKDSVSINPLAAAAAAGGSPCLSITSDGGWAMSTNTSVLDVSVPFTTPQTIESPLDMPPAVCRLSSSQGDQTKGVLFAGW